MIFDRIIANSDEESTQQSQEGIEQIRLKLNETHTKILSLHIIFNNNIPNRLKDIPHTSDLKESLPKAEEAIYDISIVRQYHSRFKEEWNRHSISQPLINIVNQCIDPSKPSLIYPFSVGFCSAFMVSNAPTEQTLLAYYGGMCTIGFTAFPKNISEKISYTSGCMLGFLAGWSLHTRHRLFSDESYQCETNIDAVENSPHTCQY